MMSFLRSYFLRIYAIERHNGERDERACLREALFQTRFLVMIATAGLGSAGVVIAGRLSRTAWAVLTEYRSLIMASFLIFAFFLAFTVVRRALVQIDDIPARAQQHSSARERMLSHVQFWCMLILSILLPVVAGLLLPPDP
jgi:hypothetical protein